MNLRKVLTVAAAGLALWMVSTTQGDAQHTALIGSWTCAGQSGGFYIEAHFDYLADGRYISRQRVSIDQYNFIEGGGGGAWRLDGEILVDTKLDGRLDRYVRNGAEVPASDPEFQQLQAQARSNIGQTVEGLIQIYGDQMISGFYTCQRDR